MAQARAPRRVLAFALAILVPISIPGPAALAAVVETASIEGRIVLADGKTPFAGVVLRLSPGARDVAYESAATDANGSFRIADLPAGDYALSVRHGEEVHRLAPRVRLAPGTHRGVLLGLAPAKAEEGAEEGWEEEDDDDDGGMTWLNNPATVTLMFIAGLSVISWGTDELDDDDDQTDDIFASPSSP